MLGVSRNVLMSSLIINSRRDFVFVLSCGNWLLPSLPAYVELTIFSLNLNSLNRSPKSCGIARQIKYRPRATYFGQEHIQSNEIYSTTSARVTQQICNVRPDLGTVLFEKIPCHKKSHIFSIRSIENSNFTTVGLTVSLTSRKFSTDISSSVMDLTSVVKKLETFASTSLAEDWDNVGLLVEPSPPHVVKTVFLTNDLTEDVLEEAINKESQLILSYHPPIFVPFKRLTMRSSKERMIIRAIEKGVAIYSPHTAYDAVKGGVNDWLISAFGETSGSLSPIIRTAGNSSSEYKLEISIMKQWKAKVQEILGAENGCKSKYDKHADGSYCFNVVCNNTTLSRLLSELSAQNVERNTNIIKLFQQPRTDTGMGRVARLAQPLPISECINKVKSHLELEHVQLALGKSKTLESLIQTVAVCAGSGGKLLGGTNADLYLTGEMSHHEVLAAVADGTSVITCNHSNTERGFLKELKSRLEKMFEGKLSIVISEIDKDPLKVV